MRAMCVFLTLTFLAFCNANAQLETNIESPETADFYDEGEYATVSVPSGTTASSNGLIDEDNCEHICARIYHPVCGNMDGVPYTAANLCEFDNKVRCALKARKAGENSPEIIYLREGRCDETLKPIFKRYRS